MLLLSRKESFCSTLRIIEILLKVMQFQILSVIFSTSSNSNCESFRIFGNCCSIPHEITVSCAHHFCYFALFITAMCV